MKILFSLLLSLMLIAACKQKDALPKGVLDKEKMEAVVWDVMRATEFLNTYVFSKDTSINKLAESQKWYAKVYQMHQTTKAEFEASYAYYKAHPMLMKEIMDSIGKKDIQTVAATPVPAPAPSEASKLDSLKKADSVKVKTDTAAATKKLQSLMDTVRKRRLMRGQR